MLTLGKLFTSESKQLAAARAVLAQLAELLDRKRGRRSTGLSTCHFHTSFPYAGTLFAPDMPHRSLS